MAKHTIAHNYSAYRDGRQFGPWVAGDEVEIDDADVEWLKADSPGVLGDDAPAEAKKPRRRAKADDADPAAEAETVVAVGPGGDGTPMTGDGPQA